MPRAKTLAMVGLCCVLSGWGTDCAWAQAAPDYDDPFLGQKGQDGVTDPDKLVQQGSSAVFQQVQESVQPFTGNLSLVYTDLVLPGNGGFDLKVQRTYNSQIWGRSDVTYGNLG